MQFHSTASYTDVYPVNSSLTESRQLPLHLVFVLFDYFPFGGQQRDFMKIANAAVAAGHQVTALVHSWQGERSTGINVVSLPAAGRTNHARVQTFAAEVNAWCKHHQPELSIGFLRIPGLDVYFAGDPCFRARCLNTYRRWIQWLPRYRTLQQLEQTVFSRGSKTHILTLSEQEQRIYQQHYGTPNSRFTALPPGVTSEFHPVDEISRSKLRLQFGIAHDSLILLMVGSHFRTKGVDRSLRALASLPEEIRCRSQLWIAGAGNAAASQRLANRLDLAKSVRFLGCRTDVSDLMRLADVLLQPSRTELAGMSIVEALCSHLPVIASGECGYASHVISSGAGHALSTPFSQKDFNHALQLLLATGARAEASERAATYVASIELRSLASVALAAIEDIARKIGRSKARAIRA